MKTVVFIVPIIGLVLLVLALAPRVVQDRMNPVTGQSGEVGAAARELHTSLLIADLHSDALLWNRNLERRNRFGHVDLPRLRAGNVAIQAFTLVTKVPRGQNYAENDSTSDRITLAAVLQRWPPRTWRSPLQRALFQARKLSRLAGRSPTDVTLIRTVADLNAHLESRAAGGQAVGAFLGLEGAHALQGELSNLDALHDAGVRMIGLAHFHDNRVAGSAHGVAKSGLTGLGRALVERTEDLGMLIDLSHASVATIDEVLEIASKPVVVSHTGVQGTCPGERNLSDRHLDAIAAQGGVIGIGFWPGAVCGGDAAAIARAITYVASRVGADHVALGSDYDGTVAVPFDASGMSWVTLALLESGMSDAHVKLVMGDNVVRVLRSTLPPR